MRPAFSQFLFELEQTDRLLRREWEDRIAQFNPGRSVVVFEGELIELLFRATEFLVEGKVTFADELAVGTYSGSNAVRARVERLFDTKLGSMIESATQGTGEGLRGVISQYFDLCLSELSRDSLYVLIDSFYEISYGPRLGRDYDLMHRDGKSYFGSFRQLLPKSILEQETEYVMGTSFVDGVPKPRMREVYVRHPEWIFSNIIGVVK